MSAELRIIIPAYNEAFRIEAALHDYCAHFAGSARISVVCNGCTDGTAAVAHRFAQRYSNLDVIDIAQKIGKGGAIRAGLMRSAEPCIGFVDADSSTSAQEYDRLYHVLQASGAAGVMGSRWLPGSVIHTRQPLLRRIASRVFNGLVRVFARLPYADTQCGAKIFRREAVQAVLESLEIADFAFDIDLLVCMRESGYRVIEVPTTWSDTPIDTKIKLVPVAFKMFFALLRISMRRSLHRWLPFFDYLARSSVMPVSRARSVLFVSGSDDERSPGFLFLQRLAAVLTSEHDVVEWIVAPRGWFGLQLTHRLRTLCWYVFVSNRRYDALVESESAVPYGLAAFSTKRCFLIEGGPTKAVARLLYRSLYRRSIKVDGAGGLADPKHVKAIIDAIRMPSLYKAEFRASDRDWAMLFQDAGRLTPAQRHSRR